jgi:23S rRNA (cytidine1920-2'-O)/16S rRNA (cytidine1409-2'-O)-methyltransferase
MTPDAGFVGLIKPQFECGRDALGGGGVVRDRKQHLAAIRRVLASLDAVGLGAAGLMKSPVRGGDGNTEFLVYAKRGVPRAVGEREAAEAAGAN